MKKRFALDDQRLKELGGGNYFRELLERIRHFSFTDQGFVTGDQQGVTFFGE